MIRRAYQQLFRPLSVLMLRSLLFMTNVSPFLVYRRLFVVCDIIRPLARR
jgi:hypothetical protein